MQSPRFESHRIQKLHGLLGEGRFAVPKLQRAFVWNGLKAAKLMDSIYLGMPIGVLTLWDTSRKNRNLLRVTTKVLPPYREHNQRVWFIVDGQQRLSVIHRALAGGVVQNGRNKQVDFDRVVFRVTDGDEVTRFQYRKPVEKTWVPVVDVLASNWRNRLNGLSNGQLNRALRCRKQLLGYKVPVIRVETEEIDEARELFLRINSAGTPLGAADRAFARASEFELREHAERAWEQLPSEFQGLTDEVLLQTRALIDHVDDVGADAMDKVAAEWDKRISADRRQLREFDKTWGRQQGATKRALDLLRSRFNVLGDGLLPSQYMVATLAVFFYHRPKQPAPDQMTQITRWFWGTAIGQRYSGRGYRQNILEDAKWFARLANGDNVAFKLGELVEPSELRRAGYGKRSSIADAFFCCCSGRSRSCLATACRRRQPTLPLTPIACTSITSSRGSCCVVAQSRPCASTASSTCACSLQRKTPDSEPNHRSGTWSPSRASGISVA